MTTVIYHNIPVLILLHHYTAIAGSKFRLFYLLHWIKDAFKWRSKVVEFHPNCTQMPAEVHRFGELK